MRDKMVFLICSLLVGLLVVVSIVLLVLHSNPSEEDATPPSVIDINGDSNLGLQISEDGNTMWDSSYVQFNEHGVEYDVQLGNEEMLLAEQGVKVYVLSTYSRVNRSVLSEYFTDWACNVIEQTYKPMVLENGEVEEFSERVAPDLSIAKAAVQNGYVEVVLKHYNYDQYFVYFKDGKIDNIEYVKTFFEESEF